MPYKRKYTKKTYKRKAKSSSSYTATAVGPPTLIRKLRYCERITIDAGAAGQSTNHFFCANSIFDPNQSGIGHQPMGFDQYILMYDHFKVLSSKIQVKALNNISATNGNQTILSIHLDDDTSTNLSVENMIEQGTTNYRIMNSGESFRPTTLTKSFNTKTFFSNQKTAASLVGTATADCDEVAFYNISSSALTGGTDPGVMSCLIVIDYIVQFSERRTLASS